MTPITKHKCPLALLIVCLALAACGQSGPLYLPGNPSRIQVEDPAAADGVGTTTSDEEEADPRD